jgi:hypothetical protein
VHREASVVRLAVGEDIVHVQFGPALEAPHLRENVAGAGLSLSEEDLAELDKIGILTAGRITDKVRSNWRGSPIGTASSEPSRIIECTCTTNLVG